MVSITYNCGDDGISGKIEISVKGKYDDQQGSALIDGDRTRRL